MKIYYVENLAYDKSVEQFYIIDFDFGFLVEFGLEGTQELTYNSWDDFYKCWDRRGRFELDGKYGKEEFKKNAVLIRVG